MRQVIGAFICVSVLLSCTMAEGPGEPALEGTHVPQPPPAAPHGDRHPNWPSRSNERFGIAIQVPPSWSLKWDPLRDGTVGDIVLVGSWALDDPRACVRIPPGQALISLSEVVPLLAELDYTERQLERSFPPRPRRFETTVLRSLGVRKGCSQPKAQLFSFGEAGRYLYAWAMFGRNLPTGVRTKAEAVLSTLRVLEMAGELPE